MTKLIKPVLAILVAAAFVHAFESFVIVPYRTNILKRSVESRLDRHYGASGSADVALAEELRRDTESVQKALRIRRTDLDLYMELAADYRFSGRLEEAARTYETALRYHRRPEIFDNLSEVQFELGRPDAAAESYSYFVAFYPPAIIWVPEELRSDILRRARARYGASAAL